jgi:hypothetical protein
MISLEGSPANVIFALLKHSHEQQNRIHPPVSGFHRRLCRYPYEPLYRVVLAHPAIRYSGPDQVFRRHLIALLRIHLLEMV